LDQKSFNGHFGQTSFSDTISFFNKNQRQAKPLSLSDQERFSSDEQMLIRGGLKRTYHGVQDVDSNIAGKQIVESGDDLRALTPLLQLWHDCQRETAGVSDDLHVVNSNRVSWKQRLGR